MISCDAGEYWIVLTGDGYVNLGMADMSWHLRIPERDFDRLTRWYREHDVFSSGVA
jgi:hypothetical protein